MSIISNLRKRGIISRKEYLKKDIQDNSKVCFEILKIKKSAWWPAFVA